MKKKAKRDYRVRIAYDAEERYSFFVERKIVAPTPHQDRTKYKRKTKYKKKAQDLFFYYYGLIAYLKSKTEEAAQH